MKIQEIAALDDYKSLAMVSKLKSSKIVNKDIKTTAKLFSISTGASNLYKTIKKTELSEKKELLSYISKIANTVSGLLESDALDRDTAKQHISKLQKRVGKIENIINSHLKEVYEANISAVTFEDMQKLTSSIQDDDHKEIEKILDANANAIKKLQIHSNSIPAKKDPNKSFVLAKVPVVAISPLTKENFIAGGFSVEPLGRYSVLQDQFVVGINTDLLKESNEKENNILKGVSVDKYIRMVVKGLENQTNMRFIIMNKPKPYRSSGLMWYWIVPEKQADRVRSQAGQNFSVPTWGFAFK